MHKTVAAIVVTYNRKVLLTECIDALLHQTQLLDKIIIINNASTDGTSALLSEKGYLTNPTIHYVELSENTGGAGGFCKGVKTGYEMGYDWIWLMDDDAEPKSDSLQQLMLFLKNQNQNDIIMVTPKPVGLDGNIQKHHRGFLNPKKLSTFSLSGEAYEKDFTEIGFSSFVGPLFSRNVIKKIGFPEKNFFIWWDDVEYSIRASKHGKMFYIKNSVIIHKDKQPDTAPNYIPIQQYWKKYYGNRNRIQTFRKHYRTSIIKIFFNLLIIPIKQIVMKEPQKIRRIKYIIRSFKDGLLGNTGKTIIP